VAFFTIGFLLPFVNPLLGDDYRAGEARFWPDQTRILESESPIEDQIVELHRSGYLGSLSRVYLRAVKKRARELWIIETHCGSKQERLRWMEDVIALEGRTPWQENVLRDDVRSNTTSGPARPLANSETYLLSFR
jgi:hypothetical protein